MRMLSALISGGLFGAGLLISGMTDTTKIQGWLDIFGAWDPTLAFVLGGAILPMAFAWQLARGKRPALGGEFPQKPPIKIDRDLAVGSILFGAGWGLAGLCPGPAMASLSFGGMPGLIFIGAMIGGMLMAGLVRSLLNAMLRPA